MFKSFNFQRFKAIVLKEILQLKRDKISVKIPIVMPIVMMILFGYAVNTEVDHVSTAVLNQSMSQVSREYVAEFSNSKYFDIKYFATSESEIETMLDSGKIKAGIIIPPSFTKDLKNGKAPQALLLIDGSDATVARTVLSSGSMVAQNYAMNSLKSQLSKKGIASISINMSGINTRVKYNPNLEVKNFTIPALIGVITTMITLMLTSFSMVREKEKGTIEQLMVTPITSLELILGKVTPYISIGYLGFLFSLGISAFYFHITIMGSIPLLLLMGLIYVICCLSMGIVVSTVASNQFQAMTGVLMIFLPSILLSGFMFPIDAMPAFLKIVTYFLPLTYFNIIDRGIVLKGVGFSELYRPIISLTFYALVLIVFAVTKFKKSLD